MGDDKLLFGREWMSMSDHRPNFETQEHHDRASGKKNIPADLGMYT
jgi:hypothetical protein